MDNAAECIARSIRVSEGTERYALHPFRCFHPAGIGKYVDLQYNIQAADTQDMPLLFHHFFCQILGTVDLKTRLYIRPNSLCSAWIFCCLSNTLLCNAFIS
ncbi:Uncharacterised protein [Neisseria meningitidis]|nr:Uncharacterised protein [Neisseria meningitidis]